MFDYNCVNLGCNRVSFKCEQNIINKTPCWLHIQQPRWDVMMPVSQLVVLVSYNVWVQFVGSDLGHWCGIFRQERSRVNRKVEIAARSSRLSSREWLSFYMAPVSYLLFSQDNLPWGQQKSPAAKVLLTTIPPHYPVCSEWHSDWLDM